MSTSDEEEFFAASPVEHVVHRGSRRKARPSSPKKVPRKKQREVLADFNVELDDSDENEDEEHEQKDTRSHRVAPQGKRKRAEVSSTESNLDEEDSGSVSSGMENRPPSRGTVSSLADDIPEEGSQETNPNNDEAPVRTRKRLSIRNDEGRRSSISTTSGAESVVATPSEVQTIYETCSQMFNANRINPQNAFNLRLLDCINQMINSPNYDKSNMQLTSSTVEIGTKIYVCRVDNTHSQVLSLASDITLQQRRKKKDDKGEHQDENNAGAEEGGDPHDDDEEEVAARRQKQKRRVIKKRGRFVEADNTKLLTGLEEQNVKFVTRRNFLKKKFNQMIYDDLEFDYLNYFLEPEDDHPLQTVEESKEMENKSKIPDEYVNPNGIGQLEFLPFNFLPKYEPETYDVWGRPLNAAEDMRHQFSQGPQLQVNDEFAYDPASRPEEYPEEGVPNNMMNDTFGEALPHPGDGDDCGEDGVPEVSFHDIRSLDHLDDYFQKVRNLLKISKSKYGWCGPNFVRPKSTWPAQKQGAKKTRIRREPERINFVKTDWNDKANKFNSNQSARTIFDEKIIESWSTRKTIVPFLGIEITSYDDDFDPLDFQNENDPKYVPTIFKLFTCRNRSILDLLKTNEKKRYSSGSAPAHIGDDGFDNDNDIELPRDIQEDFCSQPTNEDAYHPPDGATPGDAGWPFPSSIPGLLNDDPLSLVSGIDSIRFSKKPKPIDMNQLKKAILKTLCNNLDMNTETGEPLVEEETKLGLAQLMLQVLKKLDSRTEKLLSVPIFIVALMHVVADKRLFVIYDDSDPDCPFVVCRGKNFNHADHIPMPVDGLDFV